MNSSTDRSPGRKVKTPRLKSMGLVGSLFLMCASNISYASSGTEGAAFLDIPVGAGPAAMGSAYTALATNAYAATWNPAGLGFNDGTGISFQHLSYLDSIHYEYLSLAQPLPEARDNPTHRGLGFSAQYLGTGDITRTDVAADGSFLSPGGSFSSHYGAYNLSYGQTLGEKAALGLTGKLINAQIDDVSANAYAMDFGGMYKMTEKLNLAATLTNVGSQLKFLDDGDSLPLALHTGAAYAPNGRMLLSGEAVFPKTGLVAWHMGGQWSPIEPLALRVGYRTDTIKGLGALAGLSAGLGVRVWGQEFAYAWEPYGDLGNTQYFSLLLRFGTREEEKRNLIYYQQIKQHRSVKGGASEPDYQQLMQLLNEDDTHVAQKDGDLKQNSEK